MDQTPHPLLEANHHLFDAFVVLHRTSQSCHRDDRKELAAIAEIVTQLQGRVGALVRQMREREK